ncbi:hypothetical protein BDV3_005115 [Batrachochytrium dendrobatidis]
MTDKHHGSSLLDNHMKTIPDNPIHQEAVDKKISGQSLKGIDNVSQHSIHFDKNHAQNDVAHSHTKYHTKSSDSLSGNHDHKNHTFDQLPKLAKKGSKASIHKLNVDHADATPHAPSTQSNSVKGSNTSLNKIRKSIHRRESATGSQHKLADKAAKEASVDSLQPKDARETDNSLGPDTAHDSQISNENKTRSSETRAHKSTPILSENAVSDAALSLKNTTHALQDAYKVDKEDQQSSASNSKQSKSIQGSRTSLRKSQSHVSSQNHLASKESGAEFAHQNIEKKLCLDELDDSSSKTSAIYTKLAQSASERKKSQSNLNHSGSTKTTTRSTLGHETTEKQLSYKNITHDDMDAKKSHDSLANGDIEKKSHDNIAHDVIQEKTMERKQSHSFSKKRESRHSLNEVAVERAQSKEIVDHDRSKTNSREILSHSASQKKVSKEILNYDDTQNVGSQHSLGRSSQAKKASNNSLNLSGSKKTTAHQIADQAQTEKKESRHSLNHTDMEQRKSQTKSTTSLSESNKIESQVVDHTNKEVSHSPKQERRDSLRISAANLDKSNGSMRRSTSKLKQSYTALDSLDMVKPVKSHPLSENSNSLKHIEHHTKSVESLQSHDNDTHAESSYKKSTTDQIHLANQSKSVQSLHQSQEKLMNKNPSKQSILSGSHASLKSELRHKLASQSQELDGSQKNVHGEHSHKQSTLQKGSLAKLASSVGTGSAHSLKEKPQHRESASSMAKPSHERENSASSKKSVSSLKATKSISNSALTSHTKTHSIHSSSNANIAHTEGKSSARNSTSKLFHPKSSHTGINSLLTHLKKSQELSESKQNIKKSHESLKSGIHAAEIRSSRSIATESLSKKASTTSLKKSESRINHALDPDGSADKMHQSVSVLNESAHLDKHSSAANYEADNEFEESIIDAKPDTVATNSDFNDHHQSAHMHDNKAIHHELHQEQSGETRAHLPTAVSIAALSLTNKVLTDAQSENVNPDESLSSSNNCSPSYLEHISHEQHNQNSHNDPETIRQPLEVEKDQTPMKETDLYNNDFENQLEIDGNLPEETELAQNPAISPIDGYAIKSKSAESFKDHEKAEIPDQLDANQENTEEIKQCDTTEKHEHREQATSSHSHGISHIVNSVVHYIMDEFSLDKKDHHEKNTTDTSKQAEAHSSDLQPDEQTSYNNHGKDDHEHTKDHQEQKHTYDQETRHVSQEEMAHQNAYDDEFENSELHNSQKDQPETAEAMHHENANKQPETQNEQLGSEEYTFDDFDFSENKPDSASPTNPESEKEKTGSHHHLSGSLSAKASPKQSHHEIHIHDNMTPLSIEQDPSISKEQDSDGLPKANSSNNSKNIEAIEPHAAAQLQSETSLDSTTVQARNTKTRGSTTASNVSLADIKSESASSNLALKARDSIHRKNESAKNVSSAHKTDSALAVRKPATATTKKTLEHKTISAEGATKKSQSMPKKSAVAKTAHNQSNEIKSESAKSKHIESHPSAHPKPYKPRAATTNERSVGAKPANVSTAQSTSEKNHKRIVKTMARSVTAPEQSDTADLEDNVHSETSHNTEKRSYRKKHHHDKTMDEDHPKVSHSSSARLGSLSHMNPHQAPTKDGKTDYTAILTDMRQQVRNLRVEVEERNKAIIRLKESEKQLQMHLEDMKRLDQESLEKNARLLLARQKKEYQFTIATLKRQIRHLKYQRNSFADPLVEAKYFPYLPRTEYANSPRKPPYGIIGNLPPRSSDYFEVNPPEPTGNHPDSGHRWWWNGGHTAPHWTHPPTARPRTKGKNSESMFPDPEPIPPNSTQECYGSSSTHRGNSRRAKSEQHHRRHQKHEPADCREFDSDHNSHDIENDSKHYAKSYDESKTQAVDDHRQSHTTTHDKHANSKSSNPLDSSQGAISNSSVEPTDQLSSKQVYKKSSTHSLSERHAKPTTASRTATQNEMHKIAHTTVQAHDEQDTTKTTVHTRTDNEAAQSQEHSDDAKLGDRVCVMINDDRCMGELKYIGVFEAGSQNIWCGIQLDRPLGTHNGTARGRKYFDCAENHGIFVRPDKVIIIKHANTITR